MTITIFLKFYGNYFYHVLFINKLRVSSCKFTCIYVLQLIITINTSYFPEQY